MRTKFKIWVNGMVLGLVIGGLIGSEWENKDFVIEQPIQAVMAEETSEAVKESISDIKWHTGEFSAYTPRPEETDGNPFINARGQRVKEGDIACSNQFKFGTLIEVDGMGVFECNDRMASRYRNTANFDILFMDLDEALEFGRRELNYRVIE